MARQTEPTAEPRLPRNTVTGFIEYNYRHVDKSIRKSLMRRFWISCHGTGVQWAILVGLAVQTLSTLDCVMTRSSVLDAGPTIRFISGIYSCNWGVYFWAFKREETQRALGALLTVARRLDTDDADDDVKEVLRRAGRGASRYLRGMEWWSGFIFVTVIVPAVLTGKPANPSWPEPTTPGGRYALLTLHMFSTVFLPIGYFCCIAVIAGTMNCCRALLFASARRMERAVGFEQVREATELSSMLDLAMSMLNALLRPLFSHVLQSTLLMPLMCSYEIINGHLDPFIFSTGPLNVVVFIPICFAGQGATDASEAMSQSVYNSSWLEEDARCRLMRLQVMQRTSRPVEFTSRELGAINLALCQNSLRSWFSFLNFLLTTTKAK